MPALTMLSPLPVYLDERVDDPGLARRSTSLDGKVLGLLPNWRPSAVEILQGVGQALGERFKLASVVMEQPMREVPIARGRVIDAMREKLDEIARSVDVAVAATGDWGSCTTWCSHVTAALESRGVPTVMITTNSFNVFGRRIASTVGCPYVVIAVTPNPIRQLEPEAIHARVAAMLPAIVEGLTLPPAEILLRMKDQVRREIRPSGIVRSSTPV